MGLPVNSTKVLVYTLAGFCSALAGLTLNIYVGSGHGLYATGFELTVIAAVVMGGTSLSGGVGGIGGTLLGVLLMGVINNGLDLLNVSSYYQQIIKGVIIVGAVWLDRRQRE